MIECITPPCTSSVAKSCVEYAMASSSDEGKLAASFTEGVSSSAEGELAIDEIASTVSLAPNPCVVPNMLACLAARKEEECVRDFLYYMSGEESAYICQFLGGEADDDYIFVDFMSGIAAVGDAESEEWINADALASANLLVETLAEGVVDMSHLPTC